MWHTFYLKICDFFLFRFSYYLNAVNSILPMWRLCDYYVRKHIYSFTFRKVGVVSAVSAKYLRSLDSDPKQPWMGNERPQMLHRP